MGLYIGHIKTEGERPYLFSLFKSKKTPTRESHGLSYNYVSGPFKNQAEAVRAGLYQGHKPYGERTTEIAEQILMRKNPAGRKSVKFEIKDDHGRWLEVDEYVFRSWTGKRKLNGKPYRGTVHRLGSGKKNPAVREITSKSLPAMPYSFKPGIVEEIFVLAIAPKKIEKGWPVVWKIVDWSRLGVRKEHGSFTSDEVSRFVHEAVALMDRKKSQGKLKSVKHIVFVSHLAKEVTILKSY